jgi:long-chain acyl-CoA synthetase
MELLLHVRKHIKIQKNMEEIKRLFDILEYRKKKYPERTKVLAGKTDDKWRFYDIDEYIRLSNAVSYAFIQLGINKGDKVAIISTNRPEWNILDMAIMQIGAISVPIYPTISENDYMYILNHCEAKIAFVEGNIVLNKIKSIWPQLSNLKHVYTFIDRGNMPFLDQLIEMGEKNPMPEELTKRKNAIVPAQCSTIMYTSGTMGVPKGVMLSHYSIVQQLLNLRHTPAKWSDRAFSFLPLCHAYERMLVFLYQYLGMTVYYAQSLGTLAENIKEVHPTMMSTVPRVLERFYDKIYCKGKSMSGISQKIFYWAIDLAEEYRIQDCDRSRMYNFKHKIADALVYKNIRKGIGGNFDIVVSGAASIQPRMAAFFSAIGMPVFEGYGMTETSPVIAVSCREKYGREVGTVGFPLPGVEVKIDETTNEVMCRGHNVMMGYFKDEELTKQVIDKDGWFRTGDLGRFTDKGQLVLVGRLKNIFKTSYGKYVNPQVIEEKFAESPFIENIVVVGENQKYAAALISPEFAFLECWCKRHDIVFTSREEVLKNPKVLQRFTKEVNKYNEFFGETEKIKKFELIPDEWSTMNEMLTPTLKVRRQLVQERYRDLIEKMFQ